MEGQLNKLIALIGNLLNIDRIEGERLPLHEEFYNFNELINELVEELQRTTDDHKIIFNPEKEITIFGERERVEQVFTNLIVMHLNILLRLKILLLARPFLMTV